MRSQAVSLGPWRKRSSKLWLVFSCMQRLTFIIQLTKARGFTLGDIWTGILPGLSPLGRTRRMRPIMMA